MKRTLILAAVAIKAAVLTLAMGYALSPSSDEGDVALCCYHPGCTEGDEDCAS